MNLLSVKNGQIVDAKGGEVRLRGVCVGGWMNMENFINAYPGAEHTLRSTMADALGASKAEFFFDRLLDHFFAEDDLAFLKSTGVNVLRLPLNYRHFQNDAQPTRYVQKGFDRLDKMVKLCAKHGLYVILDMHAAQGWQNNDWHSDNASRHSLFWENPHFQDRFIGLWIELVKRYNGNPAIAGYNLLNEPVSNIYNGRMSSAFVKRWERLNFLYKRTVLGIRAVDKEHIIFLEGDGFSTLFDGLEAPFAPNLVYSSHNYTAAGFGPGVYPGNFRGEAWDSRKQEELFLKSEGFQFAQKNKVPLWVGEFGSVYNGSAAEIPDRLRALDDQISVFEKQKVHWTTWTYKDAGVMGWVTLKPDCEYLDRLKSVLKAKESLRTDWMAWMPRTPVNDAMENLSQLIERTIGDPEIKADQFGRYLMQAALSDFTGTLLQRPFAKVFKDLSENDIDRILQSFAFKNCAVNEGLVGVVKKYLV